MAIPDRPRPEPIAYRTYFFPRCRRDVKLVGKQEQPNYHRVNKNGTGAWCVAPGSCEVKV